MIYASVRWSAESLKRIDPKATIIEVMPWADLQPVATPLDLDMMRLALDQARLAASMGEVPVGAVVYQGDRVLAQAHNLRESNADPTAHAEVLALRAAAQALGTWRLVGCAIAVTLEPCPMCAGALVNARIDKLVYGTADPKMGCVDTLHQLCTDTRFNHRLQVIEAERHGAAVWPTTLRIFSATPRHWESITRVVEAERSLITNTGMNRTPRPVCMGHAHLVGGPIPRDPNLNRPGFVIPRPNADFFRPCFVMAGHPLASRFVNRPGVAVNSNPYAATAVAAAVMDPKVS